MEQDKKIELRPLLRASISGAELEQVNQAATNSAINPAKSCA